MASGTYLEAASGGHLRVSISPNNSSLVVVGKVLQSRDCSPVCACPGTAQQHLLQSTAFHVHTRPRDVADI